MAYYGGAPHPMQQPAYPSPQPCAPQQLPVYPQQQYHTQPSQYYGSYSSYYSNDIMKVNAWQAYNFNHPSDLEMVFTQEIQKNPENMARHALQAEDLMNVLNRTQSIRNFYRSKSSLI
ncbi:hypothetical protein EGW08_019676 [Elysia chlorotica]|uniref:Uncharacterized protein n=1 Tax=Elysia chlorotica TaxID=188477 RepID=A0A3S1BQP6_ELYCH|nr:hypothetical protein EGW08_019676 [Elysia chlorotica]